MAAINMRVQNNSVTDSLSRLETSPTLDIAIKQCPDLKTFRTFLVPYTLLSYDSFPTSPIGEPIVQKTANQGINFAS
jgi:hypothetical protein